MKDICHGPVHAWHDAETPELADGHHCLLTDHEKNVCVAADHPLIGKVGNSNNQQRPVIHG